MRKILTLLFFAMACASVCAQTVNTLPTIDDPQDADRIDTYTRGFAAAFRLDTLKSYFQAGGTFGGRAVDTIYLNGTNDSLVVEFTDGGSYLIGDIVGEEGPQGPQGVQGPTGATGPAGSDATNYWTLSSGNVYRSSGNVGIGTTSPDYSLTVNGDLKFSSSGSSSVRTEDGRILTYGNSSNTVFFGGVDAAITGLRLRTSGADRFSINNAGNVGINTTTPGAKFDVNGNVRIRNIPTGTPVGLLGYDTDGDVINFNQSSLTNTLDEVLQENGTTDESARFENGDIEIDYPADLVHETESKVYVGENIFSFDPSGSDVGYLVLNVPDAVPTNKVYYFEIQIRGYQYGGQADFESSFSGYFYHPTNTVYNGGKSSVGIPGGIRVCKNPNDNERLSFTLGDGTFSWNGYKRIEITRFVFDANSSTRYNMWDGWSYEVDANPSFNEQGLFTNDRSPFSSAGIAKGSDDVKSYHNVVCEDLTGGQSYIVLEIPNQFAELYTGEIILQNYNTQSLNGVTSRINFSLLSNFAGGNARSASVLGDFGSNEVRFGIDVNGDKSYIIIGDGTDQWSPTGFVCLDRLTASGNGAGRYGSSAFRFFNTSDLSFIPEITTSNVLVIDKDAINANEAGIYSGDGDIPLNTRASGKSYPNSLDGDARMEFGKSYQNGYNNRFYALDRIGFGIDLKSKINSSGDLIESYLIINDRSQFGGLHYTGKDILTLQSSGFAERGFSFEGGEFDYVFGPNASDRYELGAMELPDDGPATLVTTTNGETDWNTATMIYDLENNQTYSLFPAGGFLNASIGTVSLESGLYEFKLVLYYTTSTTALDVRFNTSGTSISGSFLSGVSGNTSNLTNTTEIGLNTATSERREIVTGYFTATANGSLNIQFKVDSGTAVLVAGSHLNIKKIR